MRKIVSSVAVLILAASVVACEKKVAQADSAATTTAKTAAPEDPVIIHVNGGEIHQSEFQAAIESIPEQMRGPLATDAGKKVLAEELIRMKVLEQKGETMGLDKDPEVSSRLAMARSNILANAAIEKLATGEKLSKEQIYEKVKPQFEFVKARQILIPYEGGVVGPRPGGKALPEAEAKKKAEELAGSIRSGADFAKVAKEESADANSAVNGGEMGEVSRGALPPDISKTLFALPLNTVSDPIKSRFGFHLFKVESKGVKPITDPEVEQQLAQPDRLLANQIIESLRDEAKVEFDPKFFGASAVPSTTQ